MSWERPINADVPAADAAEETAAAAPSPTEPAAAAAAKPTAEANADEAGSSKPRQPARRRRRRRIPGALKLIAATVLVAIAFIVAAVLGGSGGSKSSSSEAPAPTPVPAANNTTTSTGGATRTAEQLGYPNFATSNTTRVGGSSPAANAAAVALAVFPSTTSAQQPAAVTVVDEEDWAAAIAASVLMAAPVRAPVLISSPGETPQPTTEALSVLNPQGSAASGGSAAFAIGDVATPGVSGKVTKVRGSSAAATAAAIARLRDRLFGGAPEHLVVVAADQPDLAMPAAAWAARSGDPILFAEGDKLPAPTAATVQRHKDLPVYVLGPSTAISAAVVHEIATIDPRVHRVAGADPAANSVAFARYANGRFGWGVDDPGHGFVLARSDEPLNAAAAAALSASGTWGPLLLTEGATTLPKALREYFLDVKPGYTTNPTRAFYNHVWVIGDQEAIDVNQQAEINELAELAKIGGEQ